MRRLVENCTVKLKDGTVINVKKVNEKTIVLENNTTCNKNFIDLIY